MQTASTFFAPSASAVSAALSAESTPPDRPITALLMPVLCTSLRTKRVRISRRSGALVGIWIIAASGRADLPPSSLLWISFFARFRRGPLADAHQLVDREIDVLIAQQRRHGALAAHGFERDFAEKKILVVVFRLGDSLAERIDDLRSAPEADAVLEAAAVAVDHEQAVGLGVGAVDHLPVARVVVLDLSIDNTAQRARRRAKHRQRAVQSGHVDGRWMPEILADQKRQPPELGFKSADAIAAREITLLVEHPIGRQINLAVGVARMAVLEIDRRVEKPMIGAFLDQAGDERQLAAEVF